MSLHVCSFSDPKDYRISFDGKVYRFDWSDMFGPTRVTKTGRFAKQDLPLDVIRALSQWRKQGKRICPNGLCIWRPEHTDIPTYLSKRVVRITTRCVVFQEDRCL